MKLNSRVFILFFILFITSCGKDKQKLEAIATVNDAPILLKEFQKEISIQSRRNPSFKITSQTLENHLDTTIEKKLMIQEAMKMGLSEREQFVETIKTFWEQTLIRELIDVKSKEWADRIFVTEDEIQKQYQRMEYTTPIPQLKDVYNEIKSALLEQKRQKAMEDWFDGVKKSAIIEINTPLLKKISHE
ncbi:MAG: SurA N-terminal domain-containing protein [Nitrospinae bacterium]|nr:SurA N-terminal domain-containing protein [Nitrospinota bacterium]